ncbi:MAG: DEAD/DEAH box helicase [Endomicrobium sp.]|nr:DEAD/DEAH box helicase [Endomicrobium sp.]
MFPYDDIQTRTITLEKIKTLNNFVVCATNNSIDIKVSSPENVLGIDFSKSKTYNLNKLIESLVSFGYTKTNFVEEKLQFAVRGEILDIWPLSLDVPIRIVFEYDTIETLRFFDPSSQISSTALENVKILPTSISKPSFSIKDYFYCKKKENQTLIYFDYAINKQEEKELEDSFSYEETQDQLKAIEDIKNDFSKDYPMERLICGDVGYGKTEVALRAAFKVVTYGKQVAVLVPTTVLALQHYSTFSERLSIFPTNVIFLSRFQSKVEQKKIIKDLKTVQQTLLLAPTDYYKKIWDF